MEIRYYFVKQFNGVKVYAPCCNYEHKFIAEYKQDDKTICVHFGYEYDKTYYVDNVYKNGRNYKAYKYIRPCAEYLKSLNIFEEVKSIM